MSLRNKNQIIAKTGKIEPKMKKKEKKRGLKKLREKLF
jgi:hypothetical protein